MTPNQYSAISHALQVLLEQEDCHCEYEKMDDGSGMEYPTFTCERCSAMDELTEAK